MKVSAHAIERLCQRWPGGDPPKRPEKTIQRLLNGAAPEELDSVERTKRLISNGFQEAQYLINSGWRFVAVGGTIVTVERTHPWEN